MSTVATLPGALLRYGGVDVRVTYEYQPAERETRTDPGCAAHIEICEVFAPGNSSDLRDFFSEAVLRDMERKLLRQLEES